MQNSTFAQLMRLLRARLSLLIVGMIFISLVLIEAILLIPSVFGRRQELLDQIAAVSAGKVTWILVAFPEADGRQLLDQLRLLQNDPMLETSILGGAVYRRDGTLVGAFGEAPAAAVALHGVDAARAAQTPQGARYDVAWLTADRPEPYLLALRHNAAPAQTALLYYILRIIGAVALIAAFVTLVVMLSLGPFLIGPILTLRGDLSSAGEAIAADQLTPSFASASQQRRDELGEVINAFHAMFQQIAQAVQARRQVELELRAYLDEVAQVTDAAAAVERGAFSPASLATLAQRPDELGSLARVFVQMADELQRREALLRQQLAELSIEIDQQRRSQEVAQITNSSLFQELQAEVSELDLKAFWEGS
jgi:hypothetical protein